MQKSHSSESGSKPPAAPVLAAGDAAHSGLLALRDGALLLAYRMSGNYADAEDILQDAYLKAIRSPNRPANTAELRCWFFKIIANSARDWHRSENSRRIRERTAPMNAGNQQDAALSAEDLQGLKSRVDAELSRLDEKHRAPISLHYEQGLSYDEISSILEVPATSLRVYASEGIKLLRERLSAPSRPMREEALIALLAAGVAMKSSPELAAAVAQIVASAPGKAVALKPAIAQGVKVYSASKTGLSAGWIALGAVLVVPAILAVSYLALRSQQLTPQDTQPPIPNHHMPARPPSNDEVVRTDPPPRPASPETPPPETPAAKTPQVPAKTLTRAELDAQWQGAVELLPLVDIKRDVVSGEWKSAGGVLDAPLDKISRLAFPCAPPEEYDYRVDFTRLADVGDINLIFSVSGIGVSWHFSSINNQNYFSPKPALQPAPAEPTIVNGKHHVAIIEVRNDSLTASLDGRVLKRIHASTPFRTDLEWRLPDQALLGLGIWRSHVQFHRVAVREIAGKCRLLPQNIVAQNAVDEKYWKDAVDLIPKTVNEGNAVHGKWTVVNGALVNDGRNWCARYELGYRPPEEYDMRVVFTRKSGTRGIMQILSAGRFAFMYRIDFDGDSGFDQVDGLTFALNPMSVRGVGLVRNDQTHASLVCVRKDGVSAYLDGKLINRYQGDLSALRLEDTWHLRSPGSLGVGTHRVSAVFHKIQVKELSGRGSVTPVTGQQAVVPATPPPAGDF